ncbi:MAG: hypothetical protein AAFW97_08760 [Pseudomonadota bacterium]
MATTDLKLSAPGEIPKPGPIGRLLRLSLGLLCLYYVFGLVNVWDALLTAEGHIRPLLWNGILPGLFLVSYIVNIGFSRNWKKWPAIVSIVILAGVAVYSWSITGSIEGQWSAGLLWIWLAYVFGHLGSAFVLAAVLATPGCEMRAFHHAWSILTGQHTKEHHCPIGPLGPVDRWERKKFSREN